MIIQHLELSLSSIIGYRLSFTVSLLSLNLNRRIRSRVSDPRRQVDRHIDRHTGMSAADTFRHSALRVSVAQMVEQVGFEHCATEALELLTEVVADYLRTMCAASGDAARRAGRAKVNLNDIKTGFDAVDLDAETVLGHVEESDELGYLIEDLPYFPKPAAKASKRRDAAAATQSWPTASFAPSSSPSLSAPSRSPSASSPSASPAPRAQASSGASGTILYTTGHLNVPPFISQHLPPMPDLRVWYKTPIFVQTRKDPASARVQRVQEARKISDTLVALGENNAAALRGQAPRCVFIHIYLLCVSHASIYVSLRHRAQWQCQ
jgi:histone H3/H4